MSDRKGSIVLVQIDRYEDRGVDVFPFGILYVGSALHAAGHRVRLVHCTDVDMQSYVQQIAEEDPLFVGFSVMTGPQIVPSVEMSRQIKKATKAPIVWGGPHPSLIPDQCVSEDYIDIVVAGEGEETSLDLANALKNGQPLADIPGLGYKDNGRPVLNPGRPFIKDLDRFQTDFELIDVEKHLSHMSSPSGTVLDRVIALKTSRGCPFACTFCWNQTVHRRRWRAKSAEAVIAEIQWLKQHHGINGVKFFDDNFFVDTKRAFHILEAIGIPAQFEVRIDMLTDEVARKLAELGCLKIMIGMESGSDKLLDEMKKGFHVADAKKGVLAAAKYHIPAIYSTMCGMPRESRREVQQTIDVMLWISEVHKESRFTHGKYLPYPGTAMYSAALEVGFRPPDTTIGWGKMDRWVGSRMGQLLPWLDEDQVATIRDYFRLITIEQLGDLIRFRLKHIPRVFSRLERAAVSTIVYRLEKADKTPWELGLMKVFAAVRLRRG